jgi:hypothetical protein
MTNEATWELGNGALATIDLRVRGVTIYNENHVMVLDERQLDRLLLLVQCLPGDGPPRVSFDDRSNQQTSTCTKNDENSPCPADVSIPPTDGVGTLCTQCSNLHDLMSACPPSSQSDAK